MGGRLARGYTGIRRVDSGDVKNLIDWLTRLAPGEAPLDNFTHKLVGRGASASMVTVTAPWRRPRACSTRSARSCCPATTSSMPMICLTPTGRFVTQSNYAPPKLSAAASIVRSAAFTTSPPRYNTSTSLVRYALRRALEPTSA